MDFILPVITTLLGILAVLAIVHYFSLKRSIAALKDELHAMKILGSAGGHPDPWMRMVVEVKDPIALARRESTLAKFASGTAPALVTKKVYEQVMQQTMEQLKSKEVDANVSLIVL